MADIRINALPEEASPAASENVAIDGASTRRSTIQKLVDAGAPIASQAEAEAGVDANKRMTPLTVKQAITAMAATSAQGAKADTAVQPTRSISAGDGLTGGGDLSTDRTVSLSVASLGSLALADSALQPGDIAATVPSLSANRMLVDNAAGTARETKTFSEVVSLLEPTLDTKYVKVSYIKAAVRASQFCLGNGTNEDVAFAAFLAALKDGGRQYDGIIDLPINLSSVATLTSFSASLRCTADAYLLNTGSSDGLFINNSALTGAELRTLGLEMTLLTNAANVGVAFRFRGSEVQTDNLIDALDIQKLVMMGTSTSEGWRYGFDGTQIKNTKLANIFTRGRVPSTLGVAGALDNSTLFSVYLHDGCNQVTIDDPRLHWGTYGVYVGQDVGEDLSEGIVIRGGDVKAHRAGFVADPSQGQQFQSIEVHYDTTATGVSFGKNGANSTDFSFADGNFFLRSGAEGYTGTYVGINMNNNYSQVNGNTIWTGGSPSIGGRVPWTDSVGISIASDVDNNKEGVTSVDSNILVGQDVPIVLRSFSSGCKGVNIPRSFGNPGYVGIDDNGTGNSVT